MPDAELRAMTPLEKAIRAGCEMAATLSCDASNELLAITIAPAIITAALSDDEATIEAMAKARYGSFYGADGNAGYVPWEQVSGTARNGWLRAERGALAALRRHILGEG